MFNGEYNYTAESFMFNVSKVCTPGWHVYGCGLCVTPTRKAADDPKGKKRYRVNYQNTLEKKPGKYIGSNMTFAQIRKLAYQMVG
jgi:hypothetical protein